MRIKENNKSYKVLSLCINKDLCKFLDYMQHAEGLKKSDIVNYSLSKYKDYYFNKNKNNIKIL